MNKSVEQSVKKALADVAKKNGISVENVMREMEIAIAAARENSDPDVQALWNSIPGKDVDSQLPEEVIAHIAQLNDDMTD